MADDNLPSRWSPEDPVPYDPSRLEKVRRSPFRSNNAVHDAFDLIGGVPRLAVWADQNPGEFFTKLLPKTMQTHQQMEHSGEIRIISAVPRTALDGEYVDVSKRSPGNEGDGGPTEDLEEGPPQD